LGGSASFELSRCGAKAITNLHHRVCIKLGVVVMSWVSEELAGANLGDARRTQRLIRVVEDLAAKPNESVPQASL
jgi:hypothetical protein